MKRLISLIVLAAIGISAMAQGGIKGVIVNRADRNPVAGATLKLMQEGAEVAVQTTLPDGSFFFKDIENGSYQAEVSAPGYLSTSIFVIVEKGLVRDVMTVSLTADTVVAEADESAYSEIDMHDSGYSDNPTILSGTNDPYASIADYGFGSIRYRNRGYESSTQDVYLAGVKMNDAITGYSPFSLWSGLNEAMRSKETTLGTEVADWGVGGYNGTTNLYAVPSSVRKGWRFSVLSNSALYRLRLMATYASGELDNGWSYAFNVSARLGGNDWVKGVYYRTFAYYAGVEKKFGDIHRISLVSFATPGQRGAQNASTQEVYDLMGDNMYNSNWGYQNGKVRNSRVRRTFEPVTILKYDVHPLDNLEASASLLWRTGFNGYSALDWYDAMDPRPDYYRNLPSYSFLEDEDYNRKNEDKAAWAQEMWNPNIKEYAKYQHLDWDRLYNVNWNNPDGRSKYALEERHVDQNDIHLDASAKWRQSSLFTLTGGLNFRFNRTENYKVIKDLLGGQYYLNVDQFAERDFASNECLIQNDLDYYLEHGKAEKITTGGKYGYDYVANVRNAGVWANGVFTQGSLTANLALSAGYAGYWREGLLRHGLFAGTASEVAALNEKYHLTGDKALVSNGETSKGCSEKLNFFTGSAKAGAAYVFTGGHRISANLAFLSDAPTFKNSFVSPRTRNTVVDGLRNQNTLSADLNYQLSCRWINLRVTGYSTRIYNQTNVMSFYDDSQQSFTNFAMTGIDQRHAGIELGFKVPVASTGLSVSGVLAWGEHIYKGTPHMVQTVDNSAEVIRNEDVPYWSSHPVFKVAEILDDGTKVYEQDANGYIVDHYQKHYVPSSPQLAAELALNYRLKSYWFFELNGQFFTNSYLDMNPLYRTKFACSGGDGIETPTEIEFMAAQQRLNEKLVFLLNASIGKSWYIQRKYSIGFSLNGSNLVNNKNVRTGGYEQTRLIKSAGKDRYYRFDPKYFYMQGASYMLNVYFRF